MRLEHIILEANVAAKIKDPQTIKRLGLAVRHDNTLPRSVIARLGPKPEPEQLLKFWSEMLDSSLRSTDFGDISQDGKFDEWLTKLYINGVVDYEDINGEGGDALGAWKALSIRGRLKKEHQDFNIFPNLRKIQAIVRDPAYRGDLARIKDAEVIEKHKREKKEITIYDDDRFLAVVPMNYGSCYTFNNSNGYQASFCTGSSSGLQWFNRYADDGPIISIVDKQNQDDVNGKWQIHAATNQINNGNQTVRSDAKFAELFPGLLKKIADGLTAHAEEIKSNSTEIVSGGYNIEQAVADLKKKFPQSYNSEEPKPEVEPEAETTAGTYLVTHTESGRTARIPAESLDDVQQKLLARHPTVDVNDFTFELLPAEPEQ